MKPFKYLAGFAALLLFFLCVDPSGIGFRKNVEAVKQWAAGKSEKLRFEKARRET